MAKYLLTLLLMVLAINGQGQNSLVGANRKAIDSLSFLLLQQKIDTARAIILRQLGGKYRSINKDTSLLYLNEALAFSKEINFIKGQTETVRMLVDYLAVSGDYTQALEIALQSIRWAEKSKDTLFLFWTTRSVWRCSAQMLEHDMTIEYARKARVIVHSGYFKNEEEQRFALMGYLHALTNAYTGLNLWDSATYYGHLAHTTSQSIKDTQMLSIALHNLGDIYRKKGNVRAAFEYYRASIPYAQAINGVDGAASCHLGIARLFATQKQLDSALYYGDMALQAYQRSRSPIHELLANTFLSEVYAQANKIDSAYKYQSVSLLLKDSLFNQEKTRKVQHVRYTETLRQQQLQQERKAAEQQYQNRLIIFSLIGGSIFLAALIFFGFRIRQLKKEAQLKEGFNKKLHHTEMRALRAQMNPHFVFNCLNSISYHIVKSDHLTASKYLTKFSRLIRLILDNSASEHINLSAEIQTLQLYLEMEQLRFDHSFDACIEINESIATDKIQIPSMLLQPYVENAIWHGLLHNEHDDGKLWIRFCREEDQILVVEIEDNGIGRSKAMEWKSKESLNKKSYGMKISKERIGLLNEIYDLKGSVQVVDLKDGQGNAAGTKVILAIPFKSGIAVKTII